MKKTVLVAAVLLCVFSVFAADYEIDSLAVNVLVGRNAVNSITESYVFNYQGPHHGFYRYIPVEYDTGDVRRNVKISDIRCSETFETEGEDGFLVLKIGSASTVHTGLTPYDLSYNYDIGADTNEGYDEFYFNLIGDGWEVPVRNASFSVEIPCSASEAQIWVTRGRYGSTDQVQFSVTDNGLSITVSGNAENIRAGEALTIRVQLPENWYQGAREAWDRTGPFKSFLGYFIAILCAVASGLVWMFFGRDKVPVILARFEAPEGMTPLLVGYVADGQVDDKDVTSMLYYWADAGYMTIAEPKTNRFEFTKLKDLPAKTPAHEKKLFDSLFSRGDTVTMRDLEKSNFAQSVQSVKSDVKAYFRKERSLENPKTKNLSALVSLLSVVPLVVFLAGTYLEEYTAGYAAFFVVPSVAFCFLNGFFISYTVKRWYIIKSRIFAVTRCLIPSVLFILLMRFANAFFGITSSMALLVTCTLCSSAVSWFAQITVRRSEYADKLLEQILGYREFIEKVSVDELKMMIKENPQYYYKVLSYAIVLGLEETWAKKFESITIPAPSWYVGDQVVNAYFFSRMSMRMNNTFRSTVIPGGGGGSRSVGGGGFGSSGFAGGGFGGGGGHAW